MIAYALLAQLDRVFGYEPKGQGFESLAARQPQSLVNQGVAVFFMLDLSAEKTRFSNKFLTFIFIAHQFRLPKSKELLIEFPRAFLRFMFR